ncbi:hypothetical protein C8J57DRAFT_1220554 [Mycena rebaudengoi]|nr:hypothetical protein C8J57DRAFT_1220554 [Mycena rebaudengoi]
MAFYTGLENQPGQSKLRVCSEWSCVPYGETVVIGGSKTRHFDNWVDQIQSSSVTACKSVTRSMRARWVVAGLDILLTIRKPAPGEPYPSCRKGEPIAQRWVSPQ